MRGFPGTPGKQIRIAVFVTTVVALACAAGWIFHAPAETEASAPVAPPIKVSSDRLDFGSMAPGEVVERLLVVRNEGAEPLRARFVVDGNAFRVDRDEMILHPGIDSRLVVAAQTSEASSLDDRLEILMDGAAPVVVALTGRAGVEVAAAASEPRVARRQVDAPAAATAPAVPAQPSVALPIEQPAPAVAASATAEPTAPAANGTTVAQADTATAQTPRRNPVANRMVAGAGGDRRSERVGNELLVLPFDPATSVPIRTLGEEARSRIVSETISEEEAANAHRVKSEFSDDDLARQVSEEDDGADRDSIDRDREQEEPKLTGPVLEIYPDSRVRIAGFDNTFYPQQIGVVGGEMGGGLGLTQPIQFPMVFMSFGQSVALSQQGAVVGTWDPATGQVDLQMPVAFIDSDGDVAKVQLDLTTGTTFARDSGGEVLAMSGTPRQADSGLARLVALEKLPRGQMMLDGFVAQIEILARLDFSGSDSSTSSLRSDLRSN